MNTWLILFGYMMMLVVLALESGVNSYDNGNFFPDNFFWSLFSFTNTGRSLFFYFGLFIFYIVFKSNIKDSSLGWGIWQSIVQLILVALFSLIIVGLAPFVKQEVDKVVNKL
jgi:ABC-type branched-subunit amino acid transport system permease subunit